MYLIGKKGTGRNKTGIKKKKKASWVELRFSQFDRYAEAQLQALEKWLSIEELLTWLKKKSKTTNAPDQIFFFFTAAFLTYFGRCVGISFYDL